MHPINTPFHSATIFTLAHMIPLSLAHLRQQQHHLNSLFSITKTLLAHTLAVCWNLMWRNKHGDTATSHIRPWRETIIESWVAIVLSAPHKLPHTWRVISWWRHQMKTFSALLALHEGNPLITGGLPSQRPVICAWTNGWANTQDAGDSRRHRVHYNNTVMLPSDKLIHWNSNKCDHCLSLTAQNVGKMKVSGAVSDEISPNWRHFRFSVWRKFENNTYYTDIYIFYFETKTYQDSRSQQGIDECPSIYQSCKHRLKHIHIHTFCVLTFIDLHFETILRFVDYTTFVDMYLIIEWGFSIFLIISI